MRRHPGTFVAGILFMLLGVVYLLEGFNVWTVNSARIWPLVIIATGVIVVAGAVMSDDD